jgi:hypothetical protein
MRLRHTTAAVVPPGSLVHPDAHATHLVPVHMLEGIVGLVLRGELDKAVALGSPRLAIRDDFRRQGAELDKKAG